MAVRNVCVGRRVGQVRPRRDHLVEGVRNRMIRNDGGVVAFLLDDDILALQIPGKPNHRNSDLCDRVRCQTTPFDVRPWLDSERKQRIPGIVPDFGPDSAQQNHDPAIDEQRHERVWIAVLAPIVRRVEHDLVIVGRAEEGRGWPVIAQIRNPSITSHLIVPVKMPVGSMIWPKVAAACANSPCVPDRPSRRPTPPSRHYQTTRPERCRERPARRSGSRSPDRPIIHKPAARRPRSRCPASPARPPGRTRRLVGMDRCSVPAVDNT